MLFRFLTLPTVSICRFVALETVPPQFQKPISLLSLDMAAVAHISSTLPCLRWSGLHSRRRRIAWQSPSIRVKVGACSSGTWLSWPLVPPHQGQPLFCVLASCAALAQVLEGRTKWGQCLSSPVLSMASGMFLSSLQVIPAAAPLYDNISKLLMPMAVALTLLETDVRRAFTEAGSTFKAFWIGAVGTILGTIIAFWTVGKYLGPDGWKIASCLCASYIGGSINYAATAQALELTSGSTLAAGIAADNLAMVIYFGVIMSIPANSKDRTQDSCSDGVTGKKPTSESVIFSLAVAAVSCTLGNALARLLPSTFSGCGLAIMALVASALSAVAAHICRSHSIRTDVTVFAGSQAIADALMLLFFTVVGATCSIREAVSSGWPLFSLIVLLLLVHLVFTLVIGTKCKLPTRTILVASNANIGGPATAAAMANARSWNDLVRPSILVGTLGYSIGTVIGCLVGAGLLRKIAF